MLIIYGDRKKVKIDKKLGYQMCTNCGYNVETALAHEACHFHVCYIPVFFYTQARFKMCPNCGIMEKYTKKEFKQLLNSEI